MQEKAKNSYRRLMLLKTQSLDDRFKLAFFFFTDAVQANNGQYFKKMKEFKSRAFQFNMSWQRYNEPVKRVPSSLGLMMKPTLLVVADEVFQV